MKPINITDIIDRQREQDGLFIEFLRRNSLSMEVYRLPVGSKDPQNPHTEDEVYYVLKGEAKIQIDDAIHPVEKGDIVFVERGSEHFFFDIEADLITLIFFAPARGTRGDMESHDAGSD
jgi:mannose-1-phosphate guanylyltransferase